MIAINKNFEEIPKSLYISQLNPYDYEKDEQCPDSSKTTQKRRLEIINAHKYPTTKTIHEKEFTVEVKSFDERYKKQDIKDKLNEIYHQKCVYCETRNRGLSVEHYRPKSIYYWLSYSWDNLLLSCSKCNSYKGNTFEIENENKRAIFQSKDLKKLNNISSVYNEEPKFLNPENKEDAKILMFFKFDKNGLMFSENKRCNYTITKLRLNDEKDLKMWRYEILKKFKENIAECIRKFEIKKIEFHIENFVKESKDLNEEFIAFRQYAVKHIINNIIIDLLNN